jgi:aminoglycoside 3-N-acetyltransferase
MTAPQPEIGYEQLVDELRTLGLAENRDVLIHCGMKRIGLIDGGPATLLRAVQDVIGPFATVVVPTQTAHNSTTSRFYHEATRGMTDAQRRAYDDRIPGFHRDIPSHRMGLFAEYVRCQPGAVRSDHPQTSFTALGPSAEAMMAVHQLPSHLGNDSPLAALYDADAVALLLGVGYDRCTTLHLAEYRLPPHVAVRNKTYRCFVANEGRREPRVFEAPDLDDRVFPELGMDLDDEPFVKPGWVGKAQARLIPVRDAVEFAIGWMVRRRELAAH